jgi:hypothetical protein
MPHRGAHHSKDGISALVDAYTSLAQGPQADGGQAARLECFLDEHGRPTNDPGTHVRVTFDEQTGQVNMVVTDKRFGREEIHRSMPTLTSPTPEELRKATDLAVRTLRMSAGQAPKTLEFAVGKKGKEKTFEDPFYSIGDSHKIEYFIDEYGDKSYNPNLHVHVIIDEDRDEVVFVITDRRSGTVEHKHREVYSKMDGNEIDGNEVEAITKTYVAALMSMSSASDE